MQYKAVREQGTMMEPKFDAGGTKECFTCHKVLAINDSRISLSAIQGGVKLLDSLRQMLPPDTPLSDEDTHAESFCCMDCTHLAFSE